MRVCIENKRQKDINEKDGAFQRINERKSNQSLKTDIEIILNVQFLHKSSK